MSVITRFAPSPSGALHLGHAYAALFADRLARTGGGRMLLRIEDIDSARCRREHEAAIFDDLRWLGLRWPEPVRRQSEHLEDYAAATAALEALGVLYPCFCTRRDIAAEIARAPSAPHGPDGALYPGTCKRLSADDRRRREAEGPAPALRLDVETALARVGQPLSFEERESGPEGERGTVTARPETLGDLVLARRDIGTSYHVAVVVDDALQGVTDVSRGRDLFHATHVHRLLQALLGLPSPRYHHHDLVRDERGVRLATRERAAALGELRGTGTTREEIWARLGFSPGA